MKHVLTGLIIGVLAGWLIAGCGGGGDSGGSSDSIIGKWKLMRLTRVYKVNKTDANTTTLSGTCPGDIDMGDATNFSCTGTETLEIRSDGNLILPNISFTSNGGGTTLYIDPADGTSSLPYTFEGSGRKLTLQDWPEKGKSTSFPASATGTALTVTLVDDADTGKVTMQLTRE